MPFLLKYVLVKGDIMNKNFKKSVMDDVENQIAAIRNSFPEKESVIRKSIMSIYEEVKITTEEGFVKRQIEADIANNMRQIEILHKLANSTPDFLEKLDKSDKKEVDFDRLTYLEKIDQLAMQIIELRKNGYPEKEKQKYLDVYRHFKAMSIEDLQEYIIRCIEQQLEAANREIARLESIADINSYPKR